MRGCQLAAALAGVLGQFQRTGAGRGIDIVEMDDLLARAAAFDMFKRDVVILPAAQPRAQRGDPRREGKAHLDPGVQAFQIGLVVVKRRRHHLGAEGAFGVQVERTHQPAHVDALLFRLKADGAGDAGFQRHVAAAAGVIADRQAEVRDADMLDRRAGADDQAGRAVLQVGHGGAVGGIGAEIVGVAARQVGVVGDAAAGQQPRDRRIKPRHLGRIGRGRPAAQGFKRRGRILAVRLASDLADEIHGLSPDREARAHPHVRRSRADYAGSRPGLPAWRVAFIGSHATRSDLLISPVRGAQDRCPLLRDRLWQAAGKETRAVSGGETVPVPPSDPGTEGRARPWVGALARRGCGALS